MRRWMWPVGVGFVGVQLACASGGGDSIRIVSPKEGDRVTGEVEVFVEMVPDKDRAFGVSTDAGGRTWEGEHPDTPARWDTSTVLSGPATLVASHAYGDGAESKPVTVFVDHPFAVEFRADPPLEATLSGFYAMTLQPMGIDPITSGQVTVDGELLAEVADHPWAFELDTALLDDGPHTLRTVVQRADGTEASHERDFTSANCAAWPFDVGAEPSGLVSTSEGALYLAYSNQIDAPRIERWSRADGHEPEWALAPASGVVALAPGPGDQLTLMVQQVTYPTGHVYTVDPATAQLTELPGAPGPLMNVAATDDGRVYALAEAFPEIHLFEWTDPGWLQVSTADLEPSGLGSDLHIDANGVVWVMLGARTYRLTLDGVGLEATRELLYTSYGAMAEDDQGRLLRSTDEGIERVDLATGALVDTVPTKEWAVELAPVRHQPGCDAILTVTGFGVDVAAP